MNPYLSLLTRALIALDEDSFPGLRQEIREALEEAEPTERSRQIIELAKKELYQEGELEIDDDAEISEGDNNGAYVRAWAWVTFDGTDLDKTLG